jgi:hypothetical protein
MREVFRQFLAGNQSYLQLSKLVGVTPRGMRLIMRNPIWTGWRVIDKKRDTSAAGRYAGKNGRQSDRRKIARSADEVIRVQVISEPLIPESDFQAVQHIMDLKQAKHWRSQPEIEHRFVYNGFLTCSHCDEAVHTAFARRDYYACKGRRTHHTCATKYMVREKLEQRLDNLFGEHLTSPSFLENCVGETKRLSEQGDTATRIQRLTAEINSLRDKRARVVETFLDGIIEREERDNRLATIDRDIQISQGIMMRETPSASPAAEDLIEVFAPLVEWHYWTREQKRSILSTIVPDIRVADYQIESLGLNAALFVAQNTRPGTDSSRPPT